MGRVLRRMDDFGARRSWDSIPTKITKLNDGPFMSQVLCIAYDDFDIGTHKVHTEAMPVFCT